MIFAFSPLWRVCQREGVQKGEWSSLLAHHYNLIQKGIEKERERVFNDSIFIGNQKRETSCFGDVGEKMIIFAFEKFDLKSDGRQISNENHTHQMFPSFSTQKKTWCDVWRVVPKSWWEEARKWRISVWIIENFKNKTWNCLSSLNEFS